MPPQLEKATDPPCPNCGCCASVVLREYDRFGTPFQKRACGHCGQEFSAPVANQPPASNEDSGDYEIAAVWLINSCPYCKSDNIKVRSTKGRTRYCHCRNCEKKYKATSPS